MLEILAIAWLCSLNSKNAVSRGRKPGLFIFLTILFWILGEFLGGIIGGILGLEMGTYIVAIVLGILGGVCSFLVAKNCKFGNYVPKVKTKAPKQTLCDAPQYCENCGAKLDEGSAFCYNCGTKVPNAMPEVTPQTPVALPKKTSDAFSKAPYILGYTALILWCGIFGLHFIPGLPLMYQSNSSMFLSYTVLAVAGYLFWKRGLSHNASSYIFTAFFAVADVINPVLNLMSQKNMNRFKFSDFRLFGQYGIRILRMLVLVIVAVGLIFLLRAAFKNREKKSYALFALLFSGTVFLVRFLLDIKNMISVFVSGYPMVILVNLLSHFSVLAVLLVVLFTLSFMEKVPNKGGKNSVLGIIWAVLCIMANDTTAVLGIVNDYLTTSYAFFMGIAMMAAFVFLLAKRKYAFSLIAVLPILNGIIQLLAGISMRFSGSFSFIGILLTLFGAAANIFLTWLLLIREKKTVPQTVAVVAAPGKSSFEKDNIGVRQETAAQKAVTDTVPEKRFFERDNMGTRQETMQQALTYWMGTRPGLKVKPPFALYDFSSAENAEKALLELPFIHKAADSGKLICDRIMTFGYYAVTENGILNGEYEAIIEGTDLTLAEFKQAEAVFESYGGKRKNHAEPEATVRNNASEGDPSKVKYSETVKGNDGVSIYEVYTGPDKASAVAFLKGKPVDKRLYYVVVDTPEGSFGRDINGFYQE